MSYTCIVYRRPCTLHVGTLQ